LPWSRQGPGRRDNKEPRLIAMRHADMLVVHPNQDNTRTCSQCGEQVGIYPSGQKILARHPDTIIKCQICAGAMSGPAILAPGALEEPFQSRRRE
jgi:hypothetical protein